MDSTKITYATFPFDWTVKSTTYQIKYRKYEVINEIDEIFCSIINAKGNEIEFAELGNLLGFYLQDLAETDILNIFLKGLSEYNLIATDKELIRLTEFGQEAIQSKLKYKYYFASTELFENLTALGETFDFSFKSVFDIENSLSHLREIKEHKLENPEVKKKLQFQLFGNDIFKGEIVELYGHEPRFSYKNISLQSEITALDDSFQLSIFKSGVNKPEVQFLIELPENTEFKSKLLRKGMYHHILSTKELISKKDIENYIDLWNWKELAGNPKLDWNDNTIFELFRENGDGGIWSIISDKAPIESIKSVIEKYADYWNWTTLTERFDDEFIREHIEIFDWDFEELSYRESDFIQEILLVKRKQQLHFWNNEFVKDSKNYHSIKDLAESKGYEIESLIGKQKNELIEILTLQKLRDEDWDWNYLSKNLPDEFIEKYIEDFPWDFYLITELKGDILRNLFKKQEKSNYINILLSKPWNWKFISKEFKGNFLYEQIHFIASKVDWHIVLERFFTSEEITTKCLKDESFKALLKQHLPENFVIAHQRYIWTPELLDFFVNQNLIQWETKEYINGFDTNENVEWSRSIFQKYHNRITTVNGFLNVSKQIFDYTLISDFPDFAWNWEGISKNKKLISNATFIEKALTGELSFSNKLLWNEILAQSTFDVSFWNKNLETFYKATEGEKQIQFWKTLTQKESTDFVFENKHFPWDWSYITENSSIETILDSFEDDELFEKWNWEIATRKLARETILDNLETLTQFLDWKYVINEVFKDEFVFENSKLKIANRLSGLESEKRKEIWEILTAKYPFAKIFPLVIKTFEFDIWEWDWDYISNHNLFPTDIETLIKFKDKINWTIFSESKAIQQKFNPKIDWKNYKEWENNTDKYLSKFADNWDWKVISKNEYVTSNLFIISKHKGENWDWEYLTEFGEFLIKPDKDKRKYLVEKVVKQFHAYIKFDFLSKRKDVAIASSLILSTKDKNWDWQVLSENDKAEISNELIVELKDKNWNWKALSKRTNIEFSNETLLQLLDKDWDWNYLSENINLVFDTEFIGKTKTKPWNWKAISRHKSFAPTIELLTLTKDFELDWEHLSQHSSLNPTKELLAKFENKWHWQSITENPQINFSDIDFIQRFVDKWDWYFICKSGNLQLNKQILSQFKEYLDWNLISSNTNLDFTKEIIQEFKQFWNWTRLKENKRVVELLGNYVAEEINKNPTLNFIDKIEQQYSHWKGSIYHFSHIDNAVEIIKNRKIQSRNKARIQGDAAGSVVHRRDDAHAFARFYFRPQTPTQFYNEFLGKNTTDGYESHGQWISWYDKARGLGFPKCPIPIFFRFSLKEVLFKNETKCCVSNGNMQADSTQFSSITQMLGKFNFEYLYSNMSYDREHNKKYMNYSQQEFLVKDELSFNDLNDFEIVCPSETDRILLINLLGQEQKGIFSKIVVDRSYYNNENPRVQIEEEENELHVNSEFRGNGYFVLNGTNVSDIEILSGDLNKMEKDKIIFNSYVSLGNLKQNIKLNFVDESGRNWFVYANGLLNNNLKNDSSFSLWQKTVSNELYNPTEAINILKQNGYYDVFSKKIRHYTLETHTNLVCNVFERYFAPNYSESISLELFRSLLILHDIGKSKAFIEGDRNNQYEHTKQIIKDLWENLPYSQKELSIVLALLDGDCLGDYFQGKSTLSEVKTKIYDLAEFCNLTAKSFFRIYAVYYQCDISSYTVDAGGIKFLEHLFEYKDGKKVFDESERLIMMSPKYWEMYKQLKNEIENGN